VNVETKEEIKAVDAHTFTEQAKKSLNRHLHVRKLTGTVFWVRKGLMMQ
jgi:hypothetical protein